MHRSLASLPRTLVLVAASGASLLAAGCGDPGQVAVLEQEVTDLQSQTKKLEAERDRLASRLEAAERRMAGFHEDLLQVRKDAMSASASATSAAADAAKSAGESAAPALGAPGSARPRDAIAAEAKELADFYTTEEGRKVFEVAMRAYEAKQQDDRRDRMVKGMMEAFAQKANLSTQQTASMEKIVARTMTDIGEVWRSMRSADGGTPEERAARRTEALARTEEIRRQTEDEVKGVLDATQFEMFQQDSARLRGMMGGGMGGPGGPGGMGGGRGQ